MARYNLGLYWDDFEIQACMLRTGTSEFAIEKLIRQRREIEGGKPNHSISEDLRAMFAGFGEAMEDCSVSTALPEQGVMYRLLKRPFSDHRKIAATIGPEMETLLPLSDELKIDFLVLGTDDSGETEIEAAAAKVSDVEKVVDDLVQAGMEPEIVDVTSSVLASGMRTFFDLEPDNGYIVLYMGWRESSLCVLHGNETVLLGSLPYGFEHLAELIARSQNVNVRQILEEARTKGIQAGEHLGWYAREAGFFLGRVMTPGKEYALIPAGYAGQITDFLTQFSSGKTMIELPSIRAMEYQGHMQDLFSSLIAVSLAGRALDSGASLNFRQGGQALVRELGKFKAQLGMFGKIVAVLLVLWSVGIGLDIVLKSKEKSQLGTQIKREFNAVMPPGTPLAGDPAAQMQQQLARLLQASGPAGSSATPLMIMREISMKLPGEIDIILDNLMLDEGGIMLSGTTNSYDNVDKIKIALDTIPGVRDVKIVTANVSSKDNRVLFKLSGKAGGNE